MTEASAFADTIQEFFWCRKSHRLQGMKERGQRRSHASYAATSTSTYGAGNFAPGNSKSFVNKEILKRRVVIACATLQVGHPCCHIVCVVAAQVSNLQSCGKQIGDAETYEQRKASPQHKGCIRNNERNGSERALAFWMRMIRNEYLRRRNTAQVYSSTMGARTRRPNS